MTLSTFSPVDVPYSLHNKRTFATFANLHMKITRGFLLRLVRHAHWLNGFRKIFVEVFVAKEYGACSPTDGSWLFVGM